MNINFNFETEEKKEKEKKPKPKRMKDIFDLKNISKPMIKFINKKELQQIKNKNKD